MFGVLNIYKPKGLTSHDIVNIVRKILKIKQVGHTGTLDPFAEGVLPVCLGKATRLIDYFEDDKEYIATIKFGASTDTYDLEGIITQKSDKKITKSELETILNKFKGEIKQFPPIYSAVKVDGKKLYEYARNNETVEIKPRMVTVYELELLKFSQEKQETELRIKCSKGTYIRSIANDIGELSGCYAHLTKLIRTKAGKCSIENSIILPIEIQDCNLNNSQKKYIIKDGAEEILKKAIQSPLDAINLPLINISEEEYKKVSHGNSIIKKDCNKLKTGDFFILVYNNHVVAVGQYDKEELKVKKVFV